MMLISLILMSLAFTADYSDQSSDCICTQLLINNLFSFMYNKYIQNTSKKQKKNKKNIRLFKSGSTYTILQVLTDWNF